MSATSHSNRIAKSADAWALSRVEPLEGRRLFAVGIAIPPGTATAVFTGDGAADTVNLLDNGLNRIDGFANGLPFVLPPGIRHVVVNSGGGNDQVYYTFTNNLANNRSIEVSLGDGDDQFRLVNMYDVSNPRLYVEASGGAGNDDLRAYAVTDVDNRLDLILGGDAGNDYVLADVALRSVSTGTVFARALGGDGDDTIDLLVRKAAPADPTVINALASGGNGVDTVTRTIWSNNDVTCEFVAVVP